MERRGEERDITGMGNNPMNYTPPQIIQESPVKLPLAPILSTPSDRIRGNAMVSTRRGTSIFSPIQTLDQPYNPPPHHHHTHHQLSPPPPPPHPKDNTTPDPDPTTTNTPTAGGSSNSKNPAPPPPPTRAPPPQAAGDTTNSIIRYKECQKNHAASMGAHVVDGCGEFMPSGEDGTVGALKCAACDCHRNFHRKEVDGEPPPQQPHHNTYNNSNSHRGAPITSPALSTAAAGHQKHYSGGPTPPTMVSFGGGAAAESSSEDLNMFHESSGGGGHAVGQQPSYSGRKRDLGRNSVKIRRNGCMNLR
ncbi:hypothetical protein DH2020_015821 [Rehmannia glutinosa]|uniref:ZF-HD dimerization-type domain-containing protein n=1 Tax=Rehmannia glutinosa TaxID=99300 RepID=A0ABR0WX96_REHGL